MRFGTWNVSSLYRSGSLTAAVRELARFKLDLLGAQQARWDKGGTVGQREHGGTKGARWDKGGTVGAGDYKFFYGKGNENHNLGTIFLYIRRVSAVKKVEFVSDRVSYIVLRGRWCNIIVLNMHAPSQEKSDDSKDNFNDELEQFFCHFPKYCMKILLGDCNGKVGRENIFKSKLGIRVYIRIVMIMVLANFATSKNLADKSTMFPNRNTYKYIWTSPDEKTYNQIDHILKNRRWDSNILYV